MEWKEIFGHIIGFSFLLLIWAVTYMAFIIAFKGSRLIKDQRALINANILSLNMNKLVQKETKEVTEEVKQVTSAAAKVASETAEVVKELREHQTDGNGSKF